MVFQPGQSGNPLGKAIGTKRKVTAKMERKIALSGLTPLEFMLRTLRDETAEAEDRKWAAQNAAPYVHPRLSAITADVKTQATQAVDSVDWSTFAPEERQVLRQAAQFLLAKQKALQDQRED
jgi:hypothetical protein